MKKKILFIVIILVLIAVSVAAVLFIGNAGSEDYKCSYETRYTGCGGVGWNEWKSECYEFNMDDYQEDWTPERVCNKYTGSDSNCGGSCCINIEYRNNVLSKGSC